MVTNDQQVNLALWLLPRSGFSSASCSDCVVSSSSLTSCTFGKSNLLTFFLAVQEIVGEMKRSFTGTTALAVLRQLVSPRTELCWSLAPPVVRMLPLLPLETNALVLFY